MMKKTNRLYGQAGSALVEATVLLVVLLPVIYGVVMLGKVIDLKQTTEQAGRYAAWESTVYPAQGPDSQAPLEITQRFFGNPESTLQTAPQQPGNHPLWGHQSRRPNARLEQETRVAILPDAVSADYDRNISQPTIAMKVGQLAGKAGNVLDGLSGNSWGLTPDGLLQANVGVQLDGNAWLGAGSDGCANKQSTLCLTSSAVILVDGWSASDDAQARKRVRSLVPASALEPLGNAVSIVGNLPMFGELKRLKGAFGHVDMTVLPEYAKP